MAGIVKQVKPPTMEEIKKKYPKLFEKEPRQNKRFKRLKAWAGITMLTKGK